jgi:outer membrane immunogenic protein
MSRTIASICSEQCREDIMNRLLLAFAIIAGALTQAAAADLPPAPPPAPVLAPAFVPPPAYSWTGFYIGGNAGAAWGSFDPTTTTLNPPAGYFTASSVPAIDAAGAQSIKPAGFTGGFEAGYNWQAGHGLIGIEGDIEALSLRGSANSGPVLYPCCAPSTFTGTANASTSWLATARGRIGLAADNWLFFVTGGAAFTTLKGNFTFADTFGPATESGSISSAKTGWTLGGGVEAGLSPNWSVKAEYLYVDFGTVSVTSNNLMTPAPVPAQTFTHSIDLKASIARAGLNYRF